MKKILAFIFLFLFVFVNIPKEVAFAYDMPTNVRVGLSYKYESVDSIPITNKDISVGYETDGQFFESAMISASSGFSMGYSNQFYLRYNQGFTDYNSAKNMAYDIENRTKQKATPCLEDINTWAIYIGGYNNETEAKLKGNEVIESTSIVKASNRRTVLNDGGVATIIFDSSNYFPQIKDTYNNPIKLGDRSYRGRIEFGRYSGAKLTAVNVIKLDEYLYSVVPSEMPASWHIEALKSQACAARNYAVSNIGKHNAKGYDLCDSTDCQVYLGVGNENQNSTLAVDMTTGIMIYYDSKPIDAVFFSSSGGMTDNSENVWANSLPYLRSVKEINEVGAKQWTRTFTLADLDKALSINKANIGNATGMYIGSYNNSGRVGELIITGTKGNKSLYKEEIRTFFSSLSGGSLESRNFYIGNRPNVSTNQTANIYITDGKGITESNLASTSAIGRDGIITAVSNAGNNISVFSKYGASSYPLVASVAPIQNTGGNSLTITGSGWGHGIGMSQYGAKGMAEMGYTYEQILKYYYTGVEVR